MCLWHQPTCHAGRLHATCRHTYRHTSGNLACAAATFMPHACPIQTHTHTHRHTHRHIVCAAATFMPHSDTHTDTLHAPLPHACPIQTHTDTLHAPLPHACPIQTHTDTWHAPLPHECPMHATYRHLRRAYLGRQPLTVHSLSTRPARGHLRGPLPPAAAHGLHANNRTLCKFTEFHH
jgi:hypothetical protein